MVGQVPIDPVLARQPPQPSLSFWEVWDRATAKVIWSQIWSISGNQKVACGFLLAVANAPPGISPYTWRNEDAAHGEIVPAFRSAGKDKIVDHG